MQPVTRQIPVADGVDLRVRSWEGAAGTPFLLVHGLSSNARLWDGVARELAAAGHPVYAVDLRSHGGSDRPTGGYDMATAAADLDAVCDRLGLPSVVAVGQSWGGNVVVRFAARFGSRVAALGLVDGGWLDLAANFDSWDRCEHALRPADIDGTPLPRVRAEISASHPSWADWAVEATLANFSVDDDGLAHRRLPVPLHLRILRDLWDHPPAPDLRAVTVPALLVPALAATGRTDPRGKRHAELVAAVAGTLRTAAVRPYPGADHDIHAQQPQRLAGDLLAFAECVVAR